MTVCTKARWAFALRSIEQPGRLAVLILERIRVWDGRARADRCRESVNSWHAKDPIRATPGYMYTYDSPFLYNSLLSMLVNLKAGWGRWEPPSRDGPVFWTYYSVAKFKMSQCVTNICLEITLCWLCHRCSFQCRNPFFVVVYRYHNLFDDFSWNLSCDHFSAKHASWRVMILTVHIYCSCIHSFNCI